MKLLLAAAALGAAFAYAGPAAAADQCPTLTFLRFNHLAYAGERLPGSASLVPGADVGEGTVDEPADQTGCKRRSASVRVRRAGEVDPSAAVVVLGRRQMIFVLGGRCAGYDKPRRLDCLLRPLAFRGRRYTGTRYPSEPAPVGSVPFGGKLGQATLGGDNVNAVRIVGVDPVLAVGVRGRPNEAFLAPGVCPYERFENVRARDDLLRCLRGPVWLVFDPPGGTVGSELVVASDRPLRPELDGATISLVRLRTVGDVLPEDRSGAVPIGPLRARFRLSVPDLPEGLYETIVSCDRCAAAHSGRTLFPTGSLVVFEARKGSTGVRAVSIGLGAAVLVLLAASVVVWRRGRRRRTSQSGSAGS